MLKRLNGPMIVQISLALLAVASLVACSKGDTNTSVPAPANPIPQTQTPLPNVITTPSNLPSWVTGAAHLRLAITRDYSGLSELFGVRVFEPVVGDPKVSMMLLGAAASLEGTVYYAFEDDKGFTYSEVPSVPGAGSKSAAVIDGIYSDDFVSVHVVGTVNSTGTAAPGAGFYYRMRKAGDSGTCPQPNGKLAQDPCRRYQVCDQYYNGQCYSAWRVVVDVPCCRNYLQTTNANVKFLGTFDVDIANWSSGG